MSLTVKKMFGLPIFNEMTLLAGEKGLDREVIGVTLGEIPNYEYLNEGVVILSTGYFYKDNPMALLELLRTTAAIGVSAIGIKLGSYIDRVPDEVLSLADELKLPMFQYPKSMSFEDVAIQIQSELIDEKTSKLQFSEMILRRFTANIAEGDSIKKVMENLNELLKTKVIYYDCLFGEHILEAADDTSVYIEKSNNIELAINEHKCVIVALGAQTCGYLIFTKANKEYQLTDYEKIAVEHACTVIRIQAQKEISNRQIRRKYTDEFVYDVIENNISSKEELLLRGELYNCKIEDGMLAVIVDINNFNECFYLGLTGKKRDILAIKENIFDEVIRYLEHYYKPLIHMKFSDYLVVLIHCDVEDIVGFNDKLKTVSDKLREKVQSRYDYTVTVGIGCYTESCMNIYQSYSQAKKAISLGRKVFGYNSTITYDQLGIYNMLESLSDKPEANRFCQEYVGKIITYDEKHKTELFKTIKVLLKNDWNLRAASEDLFIHYNTMKYRFKCIVELLSLDMKNSDEKLNIALSIKLIELMGERFVP